MLIILCQWELLLLLYTMYMSSSWTLPFYVCYPYTFSLAFKLMYAILVVMSTGMLLKWLCLPILFCVADHESNVDEDASVYIYVCFYCLYLCGWILLVLSPLPGSAYHDVKPPPKKLLVLF